MRVNLVDYKKDHGNELCNISSWYNNVGIFPLFAEMGESFFLLHFADDSRSCGYANRGFTYRIRQSAWRNGVKLAEILFWSAFSQRAMSQHSQRSTGCFFYIIALDVQPWPWMAEGKSENIFICARSDGKLLINNYELRTLNRLLSSLKIVFPSIFTHISSTHCWFLLVSCVS